MRSWLFVPGDSEKKQEKARGSGADVLILDLEDSVAATRKAEARAITAAFLSTARPHSTAVYVRVNAFDTGETEADLDAIMPARPDGIVLPKPLHGAGLAARSRLAARAL